MSTAGILATALLRGVATPLFFAYIYGWLPPLDDAAVVAYVAVFWFTSGCARVSVRIGTRSGTVSLDCIKVCQRSARAVTGTSLVPKRLLETHCGLGSAPVAGCQHHV